MNKKILLWIFVFLVLSSLAFAQSRNVEGFIYNNDSSLSNNAEVTVWMQVDVDDCAGNSAYCCNCSSITNEFTSSRGYFIENAANLGYSQGCTQQLIDNSANLGDPCQEWNQNTNIVWAVADGSTVNPTPQGNGRTADKQYGLEGGALRLDNLTLSEALTINNIVTVPPMPVYNDGEEQNISVNFTSNNYPIQVTFNLYNSSGDLVDTVGPLTVNNADSLPTNYTIPDTLIDSNYTLNMSVEDDFSNSVVANIGTIVVDSIAPAYSNLVRSPDPVNNDDDVVINVTWTDATNISPIYIRHNATGVWVNYTPTKIGDVYTLTIPSSMIDNLESIGWNSIARDQAGNWNDTMPVQSFTVSNRAPAFNASSAISNRTWYEDNNETIDLSSVFYDDDGDSLSYSYSLVENITVIVNNNTGIVTLVPDANFYGVRHVVFYAHDGINTIASNNVTLNITSVNDLPVLNFTDLDYMELPEDTYNDTINLSNYVTDVEDSDYLINWSCFSDNVNLSAVVNNATKILNVSGLNDYFGYVTVNCTGFDTDGGKGSTLFVVNVTAVNDAPVWFNVTNATTLEDITPPNNWYDMWNYSSDVDNGYGELTYSLISQSNSSLINCVILSNRYVNCSTPFPDAFGNNTLNISMSDGEFNDTVNLIVYVISVNDPPTSPDLLYPPNKWASKNNTPYFNLSDSTDPDDDNLTYFIEISNSTEFITIQLTINSSTSEMTIPTALALPDGYWYWRAVVCDDSGEANACTSGSVRYLNITTDTTPPVIRIDEPDPDEILGWTIPLISDVSDFLLNVSHAWYEMYNGTGDLIETGNLSADGEWDLFWDSSEALGYGSSSVSGYSSSNSITGNAVRSDELDREIREYYASSGPYTVMENVTSCSINFTYVIYANDTVDNVDNTSRRFCVDLGIPSVNIIFPKRDNLTDDFNMWIQVQSENLSATWFEIRNETGYLMYNNSNYSIYARGINWTDYIPASTWVSGTYNITAYGEDVGGINRTVRTYFMLDVDPPLYSNLIRKPDIVYNDLNVQINSTWTDNNIVQTVMVSHNASGSWINYSASKNGSVYYYTIPASMLENQERVGWKIYGQDNFGNWNGTMPINVFNVTNRPPVLNNSNRIANQTWAEDNNATINLFDHFYDLDLDNLTFYYSGVDNITIIVNNITGVVTFVPDANFYGIRYVVVYATDVINVTASNNVTLNVTSVNDLPVVDLSSLEGMDIDEDTYNDTINMSNYVYDVEDNDGVINWSCVTNVSDVTAIVNNFTKILNLSATNDFYGDVNVICTAVDRDYGQTNGSFNLTVNSVNDAPIVDLSSLDGMLLAEDTFNATINLSNYVADVEDSDASLIWSCNTNSTNVNATVNNGNKLLNVSAHNNYVGIVTVTCTALDTDSGQGQDTFTVNVTAVNDAPIVDLSALDGMLLAEDTYNDSINMSDYVYDVEDSVSLINWSCVTNESDVSAVVNNVTKILNISSSNNFFGVVEVNCTASDSEGGQGSGLFTVNVTAVNDAPIVDLSALDGMLLAEDTYNDTINLSYYVTDAEDSDDLLEWNCSSNNINLSVSVNDTTKILNLSALNDYSGIVVVTCIALDTQSGQGLDTFNVNITPVNDPPTISGLSDHEILDSYIIPSNWIDLWNYSSDVDNATVELNYAIVSQSNETVINCTVLSDRYINCTGPTLGVIGYSNINVSVTDGQYTDYDDFRITVVSINVELVSPEDNYVHPETTINLTCNATTSAASLVNITLYHNASGWKANRTVSVTGQFNETTFTLYNLSYGIYTWNCMAFDSSGSSAFDENRSFEIRNVSTAWSNLSYPFGIYEPLCCSGGNTGQDCIDLGLYDESAADPGSRGDVYCNGGGNVEKNVQHTIRMRFRNLTVDRFAVLKCIIETSGTDQDIPPNFNTFNGQLIEVNATNVTLVNSDYYLNYTLSSNDVINYSVNTNALPWYIHNCSAEYNGDLLYYENISRRIIVHRSTAWTTTDLSNAINCETADHKFFNNVRVCNRTAGDDAIATSREYNFAFAMVYGGNVEGFCYDDVNQQFSDSGIDGADASCQTWWDDYIDEVYFGGADYSTRSVTGHVVSDSPYGVSDTTNSYPTNLNSVNVLKNGIGPTIVAVYDYTVNTNTSSGNYAKFRIRSSGSKPALEYTFTIKNLPYVNDSSGAVQIIGDAPGMSTTVPTVSDVGDNLYNVQFGCADPACQGTSAIDIVLLVPFTQSLNQSNTITLEAGYTGGDSGTRDVVLYFDPSGLSNNNESETSAGVTGTSMCGDGANNDLDISTDYEYINSSSPFNRISYSRDCADVDCVGFAGPSYTAEQDITFVQGNCEYKTETNCADGYDNDFNDNFSTDAYGIAGTYYTDCHDIDCFRNGGVCPASEAVCNDGLNNDWDYVDTDSESASGHKIGNTNNVGGTTWNNLKYHHSSRTANLIDCEDPDCNGSIGGSGGELCEWAYENNCNDGFNNDALQVYDCNNNSATYGTVNNQAPAFGHLEYDCAIYCRANVDSVENGVQCDDGLDDDWDYWNATGIFSGTALSEGGLDCGWNGSGKPYNPDPDCHLESMSNGKRCELGVELTCNDSFDNDYDDGHTSDAGWSAAIYNAYFNQFGMTFSSNADCDDYDCAGLSNCPTNEAINDSWCFDNADNDLDGSVDCADTDCLGKVNPSPGQNGLNSVTQCANFELNSTLLLDADANTSSPNLCGNLVDDENDPANDNYAFLLFGYNSIGDTISGAMDCRDADCYLKFGRCAPCASEEFVEWNSCFDGLDNDHKNDGIDTGDGDCAGSVVENNEGWLSTDVYDENNAPSGCMNSFDDDSDGSTDCRDSVCTGSVFSPDGRVCGALAGTDSNCNDDFDNDNSGGLDCYDTDCYATCGVSSIIGSGINHAPTTTTSITTGVSGLSGQYASIVRKGDDFYYRYWTSTSGATILEIGNTGASNKFPTSVFNLSLAEFEGGNDGFTMNKDNAQYGYLKLENPTATGFDVTIKVPAVGSGVLLNDTTVNVAHSLGGITGSSTIEMEVVNNVAPSIGSVFVEPNNTKLDRGDLLYVVGSGFTGYPGGQSNSGAAGRCRIQVSGPNGFSIDEYRNDCKSSGGGPWAVTSSGTYDIDVTIYDNTGNQGNTLSTSQQLDVAPIITSNLGSPTRVHFKSDGGTYSAFNTASAVISASFATDEEENYPSNSCYGTIRNSAGTIVVQDNILQSSTGSTTTCTVDLDIPNPTPDGIYYITVNATDSRGYSLETVRKVFFVCDSLASSGVGWDCSMADFDVDGYTEGINQPFSYGNGVSLYTMACDSCPGATNTGKDSDGDGYDDVCDIDQDVTPPVINYTSISPSNVTIGDSVYLKMNATDNIQVDSCWANITLPNATVITIMNVCANQSYVPPIVGSYNVTFYVNDTGGNVASANATFTVNEEEEEGAVVPPGEERKGGGGAFTNGIWPLRRPTAPAEVEKPEVPVIPEEEIEELIPEFIPEVIVELEKPLVKVTITLWPYLLIAVVIVMTILTYLVMRRRVTITEASIRYAIANNVPIEDLIDDNFGWMFKKYMSENSEKAVRELYETTEDPTKRLILEGFIADIDSRAISILPQAEYEKLMADKKLIIISENLAEIKRLEKKGYLCSHLKYDVEKKTAEIYQRFEHDENSVVKRLRKFFRNLRR